MIKYIIKLLVLLLFVSCSKEELDKVIVDPKPPKLFDYSKSWDIVKNFPNEVLDYRDLNYFPDCWLDTTSALADFNLDGYNDILLAPLCTDDDLRQPPIKLFLYNEGRYIESNIQIDNNIGPISGTRTTIVGDYNGDKVPDVVFIAHNGHGYDGGVPSILLSSGKGFVFKELSYLEKAWFSEGTSGDIDNDGDLDIILNINQTFLINDGSGNFSSKLNAINNYNDNSFGVPSLIDVNKDGYLDLFFRDYDSHKFIINDNGTFDYSNSVNLQMPEYFMQLEMNEDYIKVDLDIKDRLFVDYDKDGDLDIITVSIPHNPDFGSFDLIQVLRQDSSNSFVDVSNEVLNKTKYAYYIQWLRAKDLDKDGYIEIFENQLTDS